MNSKTQVDLNDEISALKAKLKAANSKIEAYEAELKNTKGFVKWYRDIDYDEVIK